MTRVPVPPELKEAIEKHCRIVYNPFLFGGDGKRYVATTLSHLYACGGPNDYHSLVSRLEGYRKHFGTYGSIYRQQAIGDPVGLEVYSVEKNKNEPPKVREDITDPFWHYHNERIEEEKAARRDGTWVP